MTFLPMFLLAAAAASAPAAAPRPDFLLVTIDTLRFDRTLPEGPMPRWRRLAARGVSFTQAHCDVPLTLPSHATMLTGRGPLRHGVRDNIGYAIGAAHPTLAESFSRAGYRTAAFVGGYPLRAGCGLSRGFGLYDDTMTRTPPGSDAGPTERRGEEVVSAALKWLDQAPGEPFFVWVHLYDPHDPYDAPPPFRGRHPLPYDDEVAYVDAAIGPLLDRLEATGRAKTTWIVATADHGESLGEHAERTHGIFLYESTLHVPLLIVPPGGSDARTVTSVIGLADIAPTLLEAAGLEPLQGAEGRSLMPMLRSDGDTAARGRVIYIESDHGRRRYGWATLAGLLDWPWKYVEAPHAELYDLEHDPTETRNIMEEARRAGLRARLEEMRRTRDDSAPAAIDPEEMARLASLGYTGGTTRQVLQRQDGDRSRPDPKERVVAIPDVEAGLEALAGGRHAEARVSFQRALKRDPDNLVALNNLGIIALSGGDPARAEEYFRRGLDLEPGSEQLANDMGVALSRQGRHAESAVAYRRALGVRPGFTGARFNLAMALHRLGRDTEALAELEQVVRQEPGFPGLRDAMEQVRAGIRSPR